MFPIFFSVASADVAFAEGVWRRFGSDLIYLYSQSGRQGAEFWSEIESDELPNARGLVIFWSWAFVRSGGTRRELERAVRLFKSGQLRSVVVLRLDDCPLSAPVDLTDAEEKKTFADIAPILAVTRASEPGTGMELACQLCDALITQYVVPAPPIFPRPSTEEELFRQIRIDHRTFRPLVWVSGLNGNGRRTVLREGFRRIDPNAIAVEVDVSECSIPKQLVLRLESEAFQCSESQLAALNADPACDTPEAVAAVIERIRRSGRYTVLRQQRVAEERVTLPDWLLDVALALEPSSRPAAFVVAAAPISSEWLQRAGDKIGALRVSSLLPHESEEFAWNLIRHYDSAAERWSDDFVRKLVSESGGTPELIVGVVRLASRMADHASLDQLLGAEAARFSQTLSNFVDWAVGSVSEDMECMLVLRLLQDVNPISVTTIGEMLGFDHPVANVLGRLRAIGLVEATESGLFRLSPLLSRRMDRHLIDSSMLERYRTVMKRYVETAPRVADHAHGYIRIEAAIQAALRFGDSKMPPQVRRFVSAAHWFQVGVGLYGIRHYRDAHSLLREAFGLREAFRRTPQMEVARYFGLAAVRVHRRDDVEAAVGALSGLQGGKELIDYLWGFQSEIDHHFVDAMHYYSDALRAAEAINSREREARVLRPLISCILRTPRPDYRRAEQLARRAAEINRTVFSLMNLAKVLVNRVYRDPSLDEAAKDGVWDRYLAALEDLEHHPGSSGAVAEVRAEEAQLVGDWKDAVDWMDQALATDSRIENRLRRWKIMIRSKDSEYCRTAVSELEQFFVNPRYRADVSIFKLPLLETFAMGQKVLGNGGNYRLDQFGQGIGGEQKARIVRDVGRMDPGDPAFAASVD